MYEFRPLVFWIIIVAVALGFLILGGVLQQVYPAGG